MKTAIDFYERGKLKEANADEYNRAGYYSKNRFICPECGEAVHLTGSKYSNFFSHYKKTDISAECERRVDAVPTSSLYQRMGLPLYLRYENRERFGLYIGFKKIPEQLLKALMEINAATILDGKTRYSIGNERFSSKETTLIEIDYIPMYGINYKVSYSPEKAAKLLLKSWSDYADGFSFDGALFTVTGYGGKKIRHGDTISCDTEYYWVRRQPMLPSYIPGIDMEKVGVLGLKEDKWYVYKGHFTSSLVDYQYEQLCQYLRNNLKVHLLEKKPEFIPIWPPVTKCEDGYLVDDNISNLYGFISSGNEEPKVYEFKGNNAIYNELSVKDNVARVSMDTDETVLNIDRKYISNGVVLLKEKLKYEFVSTAILAENGEESISIEGVLALKSAGVRISGDIPFDTAIIRDSGEITTNTGMRGVLVDDFDEKDVILVMVSQRLIGILYNEGIESNIESDIDLEKILKCIVSNRSKEIMNIPFRVRKRLICLLNRNEVLDREIQRVLRKNMISRPVINFIESEGYYE